MIRYLLIIVVFLSSKNYAQKNDFNGLLLFFDSSKKEIPLALAKKYFDFKPTERSEKLFAGKIVAKTNDYIIASTILECNAGGSCEQSSITSFSNNGERIDTIAYEREMADCSFDDKRKSIFIASDLLVFKETREKLDCLGDGKQIGMKEWLEFQPIKENGAFSKPYTDLKAIERDHYIFSHRVFTLDELNKKTEEELAVIKNEIFASHGYMFTTEKWQDYFESKSWYMPSDDDATGKLTEIEKKNIELILSIKE